MNTIRTGALFALLGILLGPVLLNLIGFGLPLLSVAMDSVDAADGGMDQLVLARKFVAPASILMVIAAWLLTPVEPNENGALLGWRMLVRLSALAWAIVTILAAFEIRIPWLGAITWMAFLVFGLLQLARICRTLGRARLAAATVVLMVLAVAALLLPQGDPDSPSSLLILSSIGMVLSVTATAGILIVLGKVRRIEMPA